MPKCGVDDVRLDGEVVANEIGRIPIVGQNTADSGGGEINRCRLAGFEKLINCATVGQIELVVARSDQSVWLRDPLEQTHDRASHHAGVPSDVNTLDAHCSNRLYRSLLIDRV